MTKLSNYLMMLPALVHGAALAMTPLQPITDAEVLEILPSITRQRPSAAESTRPSPNSTQAALVAREAIAMARQTGETRYWGHAQAALAPWWNRPDAPVALAILQATVQQGRHEFDAARQVLESALKRDSVQAQAWLTLASLHRLSARYGDALGACDAVARAGQPFYAQACLLETLSLQGQNTKATQGLLTLLKQSESADQRGWLWSLLAENLERGGLDKAAQDAYQKSLAQGPDLYTAIAYSDLLLRTGQTIKALQLLATSPPTDAVLLRRAAAWKRLGDPQWKSARTTLQERSAELVRRGDDPSLHGRELALVALWLDDNPRQALVLARANLGLQREPLDFWVAVESAHRAKNKAALLELAVRIESIGLKDRRLKSLPPAASAKATTGTAS